MRELSKQHVCDASKQLTPAEQIRSQLIFINFQLILITISFHFLLHSVKGGVNESLYQKDPVKGGMLSLP